MGKLNINIFLFFYPLWLTTSGLPGFHPLQSLLLPAIFINSVTTVQFLLLSPLCHPYKFFLVFLCFLTFDCTQSQYLTFLKLCSNLFNINQQNGKKHVDRVHGSLKSFIIIHMRSYIWVIIRNYGWGIYEFVINLCPNTCLGDYNDNKRLFMQF